MSTDSKPTTTSRHATNRTSAPSKFEGRLIVTAYAATLAAVLLGAGGFAELLYLGVRMDGTLMPGPEVLDWWRAVSEGLVLAVLSPFLAWYAALRLPEVIVMGRAAVPASFGMISAAACMVGFIIGLVIPGVAIWETHLPNGVTAAAMRAEMQTNNVQCQQEAYRRTPDNRDVYYRDLDDDCRARLGQRRSVFFAVGENATGFAFMGGVLMYGTLTYALFAAWRARRARDRAPAARAAAASSGTWRSF